MKGYYWVLFFSLDISRTLRADIFSVENRLCRQKKGPKGGDEAGLRTLWCGASITQIHCTLCNGTKVHALRIQTCLSDRGCGVFTLCINFCFDAGFVIW